MKTGATSPSEREAIIVTPEHAVKRCVVLTAYPLCHLGKPLFDHGSGNTGEL
jgi:hypothetical protein